MGQTPSASDALIDSIGTADDQEPLQGEIEKRVAVVSPREHGKRLDQFLVAQAPEFSRSYLQSLVEGGYVRVDQRAAVVSSKKVALGQSIEIELMPTPESRAFRAEPVELDIVFEDEHLLVMNKAPGVVVHPAAGNWSGTVLNGLLAHHPGAASLARAGIVHRLDKDTSGLMVVGKTLVAVTALVRAIAARDVHRQYLAICHGKLKQTDVAVNAPVGRDPASRIRMAVVSSGKPAQTDVTRLAVADVDGAAYSGVRCVLHTGRTHQIRVHMASLGHPLLGDELYGGRVAMGMARQALHAAQLAFEHPVTHLPLVFNARPPDDFCATWRALFGDMPN
ncbi:RluA family pseudouridine synthase [Aquabacterium sp.]|uniref:RluA family pseudouridine synthase n=1 Tax=Aquabacterium sp. TaxID=1872578 RepID=UPI0035AF7576